MARRAATLAVVATALAIGSHAASAGAAPQRPWAYPPTVCPSVALSTTQPAVGGTFTISGINFLPNASVALELTSPSVLLATAHTDSTGSFSTTVTLPAGVTGQHDVVATSGVPTTAGCTPSAGINILQVGGVSISHKTTPTAITGVQIAGLVLGALVLLGAGVAFSIVGRRRRAQAAKP
ncbi:MAG TPA: hypothetical protein VKB75_04830 [Jatrophihabitans sp.]|nr:hypothetical protein [Jatrophihabitans sp.]